jgi:hypothetical protein
MFVTDSDNTPLQGTSSVIAFFLGVIAALINLKSPTFSVPHVFFGMITHNSAFMDLLVYMFHAVIGGTVALGVKVGGEILLHRYKEKRKKRNE